LEDYTRSVISIKKLKKYPKDNLKAKIKRKKLQRAYHIADLILSKKLTLE